MAQRTVGRLRGRQVTNAKPKRGLDATLLADGGNLYLQVTRGEGDHVRRSWLFRYERNGRRREMGLGALHTRGLKEAREEAKRMRQLLLDAIDPIDYRKKSIESRAGEFSKRQNLFRGRRRLSQSASGRLEESENTLRNGRPVSRRTRRQSPPCRWQQSIRHMYWRS